MTSIELAAPAKVNLFLKVLKRRKDSYHNILTLFERITLADEIKISKISKGISVYCDKFITRNPKDNLAYRAALVLLSRQRIKGGVRIEIKKKIPVAGGLGGGSADAASVLVGMNKLFGLGLEKESLLRLAKPLGADVPFFVLDAPFAVGKERGDNLKALYSGPRLWHLIINPGFGVSTKDAYNAFDAIQSNRLTRTTKGVKMHLPLRKMDFDTVEEMLHNDLEETVVSKNSLIGEVRERLASSLGKKFIVSGSGPSLFCLYRTRKEAIEAKEKLFSSIPAGERRSWQVFIVATKV